MPPVSVTELLYVTETGVKVRHWEWRAMMQEEVTRDLDAGSSTESNTRSHFQKSMSWELVSSAFIVLYFITRRPHAVSANSHTFTFSSSSLSPLCGLNILYSICNREWQPLDSGRQWFRCHAGLRAPPTSLSRPSYHSERVMKRG